MQGQHPSSGIVTQDCLTKCLLTDHYASNSERSVLMLKGRLDGGVMAAEDAVNNAYYKLFKRLEKGPVDINDTIDKYVGRTVHNAFLDMLNEERNQGISRSLPIEVVDELLSTEFNQLSPVGFDLRRRIRKKKRPCQDYLIFFYEHSLPHREIAEMTGGCIHSIRKYINKFRLEMIKVYA